MVDARDELRRPAAHVDHEVRLGLGEPGGRAEELERGLVGATEELGPLTEQPLDRVEEFVAVGRVPERAGRRHGTRSTSSFVIASWYSRSTAIGAFDRFGIEAPGLVHALTETRDPRAAVDSRRARVATGTLHVGDEEANRVGPDVDRGDTAHRASSPSPLPSTRGRDPTADRIVAAGQEPRVVRVEALDPPPCAADAVVRARAGVAGGNRGFALGRVAIVRRLQLGRVDRGLGRAHAPGRLDPRDPRHETGIDEPDRVGIGVPSPRSGELRMTTGEPAPSRTTTSTSPRGARPRRTVSAATSESVTGTRPSLRNDPGQGAVVVVVGAAVVVVAAGVPTTL